MSYWQESVRQEAITLIDSLGRGEPRERDISLFARRYNAQSVGDLIRKIGLSPGDFSELGLSPRRIVQRGEGFVRTGRGFGRLRLWIRELASICMLPSFLRSPGYHAAVDRSIRLLHLVLDPVLVPDREQARHLTGVILAYLQGGMIGTGPYVIRKILTAHREANLVTFQTGLPDQTWADIAFVVRDLGRGNARWFVPLTVISRDFERSFSPEPVMERSGESGDGGRAGQEAHGVWRDTETGRARIYEIAGKGKPDLLSYHIDCDGLSWVKCWVPRLDRGHLQLAASLFCAACGIRKACLDAEALKTSVA